MATSSRPAGNCWPTPLEPDFVVQTIALRRLHLPPLGPAPAVWCRLGRCSKEEQREFEAAYLRNPNLFDQLMELEAAVIAAYRRGELSTDSSSSKYLNSLIKLDVNKSVIELQDF